MNWRAPFGASLPVQPEDRLDSWKKIASYLRRDVSTDFDISAAGSEIVFDRVQVNSDLALIERTHQ
jgi:hypothetical protein